MPQPVPGGGPGGSLFLDEMQGLSPDAQYALLVAILDRGADARIICRHNGGSGSQAVAKGAFNADLFYRLDVMRVRMPGLEERPSDIPVLFRHYVAQAAEQAGIQPPEMSSEHMVALMAQVMAGQCAFADVGGHAVCAGDARRGDRDGRGAWAGRADGPGGAVFADRGAWAGKRQGRWQAAQSLKLPRKTFYDKLARYGIRPEDYRR